jgi:tryptophan synthase beta chain
MGADFVPPPVHVGGLRNHHTSAPVSLLRHEGVLDAVAFDQRTALEAGRLLLQTEGLLLAPEASHAVAAALDVVAQADAAGRDPVIVILASGSGQLDLQGYNDVLRAS